MAIPSYLLVLDSLGKLVPEGEVGDGHVVHDEVELLRAVGQLVPDAGAHGLTLAQQLFRVVLGHHGLQHLDARARVRHYVRPSMRKKKKERGACVLEAYTSMYILLSIYRWYICCTYWKFIFSVFFCSGHFTECHGNFAEYSFPK